MLHAKNCIYWPGINHDFYDTVELCDVCQCFQASQAHGHLASIQMVTFLWQLIGVDLLSLNGEEWLLLIDFDSNMLCLCGIVHSKCGSIKVITLLKEIYAQLGLTQRLHVDISHQFACVPFYGILC